MTDIKTETTVNVDVTTAENESLKKANDVLKKRVIALENDLKNLSNLFSEKLLSETDIVYDTIEWHIELGKIIGLFDDNKLIIDLTENSVDIQKVVHQNLYCCKNSVSETPEVDELELMPPLDCVTENEEPDKEPVDEDTVFDMKQLYQERTKSLIEEHIAAARNLGGEMFINSNGSVAYPLNFLRNIQGYIAPKTITLDDYDVLVECILDDFKNVEILEDDNTIVFHFGD